MRVVLDIEANGLTPTIIWVVVVKDIDNGRLYTFRTQREFQNYLKHHDITLCICHNGIAYDLRWLSALWDCHIPREVVRDTLVLSKLLDQQRSGGHSLEAWGEALGFSKTHFDQWDRYSDEMLQYCINDVHLNHKLYEYLEKQFRYPSWEASIKVEHEMAYICLQMELDGFNFNTAKAEELLAEINGLIESLDKDILDQFKPVRKLDAVYKLRTKKDGGYVKHIEDKLRNADCEIVDGELHVYTWETFNPQSQRQICERLKGYWSPTDKTDGHKAFLEERKSNEDKSKEEHYLLYGWRVNETNLGTLSEDAPQAAHSLVKRIMLGARQRTLQEWLKHTTCKIEIEKTKSTESIIETILSTTKSTCASTGRRTESTIDSTTNSIDSIISDQKKTETTGGATESALKKLKDFLRNKIDVAKSASEHSASTTSTIVIRPDELEESFAPVATSITNGTWRIHAQFNSIGTATHRLSHTRPNLGNVSAEKTIKYKTEELRKLAIHYGGEFRRLYQADDGAYLVGTDMEGAHLRIFAHLIKDPELIQALVSGDKKLGTDPHTINKRKLGSFCPDRDLAKTFIFTFLNGGGVGKVSEIFGCSIQDAKRTLDGFIKSYPGLQALRDDQIVSDAKRGWFRGLDGRKVLCDSEHLMISRYLQNGEAVVIKHTVVRCMDHFRKEKLPVNVTNIVHDEIQFNVHGDLDLVNYVGEYSSKMITQVGLDLGVQCPLAGEWKYGRNWLESH